MAAVEPSSSCPVSSFRSGWRHSAIARHCPYSSGASAAPAVCRPSYLVSGLSCRPSSDRPSCSGRPCSAGSASAFHPASSSDACRAPGYNEFRHH